MKLSSRCGPSVCPITIRMIARPLQIEMLTLRDGVVGDGVSAMSEVGVSVIGDLYVAGNHFTGNG